MPESAQPLRKLKSYNSSSSCDSGSSLSESGEEMEKEDHNEKKEKKVSYDLDENKYKSLERSGRLNDEFSKSGIHDELYKMLQYFRIYQYLLNAHLLVSSSLKYFLK